MKHLSLTQADWLALDRELSKRSLSEFLQLAWRVLEPGQPYLHGWHMDAMAEHLEAVSDGQLTRLLINVPPGTSKSTLCGIMFPAWLWGPAGKPSWRIIGASHEQGLATRDNRKTRLLIESEWYQERWPLELVSDQNEKTYFENGKTGFRQATAVASMTGRRGDVVVWDDPHSPEKAYSEAHRETAIRVFTETLPTRLNNPDRSAIIVVMQRLHEDDISGHILANDLGWDHLCLPMEFEVDRKCVTSIGFEDPRTDEGELLMPSRFPAEVIERDKRTMGDLATAGQFQQRPAPKGGSMFPVDRFEPVDHKPAPSDIVRSVRYWDKAGTSGGGAYTAGVLMHQLKDGRFCVEDVQRGQWGALDREERIKQTATLDGKGVRVGVEQEPGSGGKESAESTIRSLAGFKVYADRPTGEKEVRAEPYAAQVQGRNVQIVRGDWNRAFLSEHEAFPNGKYKDQVDAAAAAFGEVAKPEAQYSWYVGG